MGLFSRNKNNSNPLIRQIIDYVPRWMLESCSKQFNGNKGCSKYRTYDQFVSMTFEQLTKCYTLSDISTGIGVNLTYVKDLGLAQSPVRSTMSDGNKNRDWKIFETLYNRLMKHYETLLKTKHLSRVIEEIKGSPVKNFLGKHCLTPDFIDVHT